ncbi:MAG: outer membrane beta-barrel protein [Leeuwenhoekiella sp.]
MKIFFSALLIFACSISFAQEGSGFGVKAGLNYHSNGDISNDAGDVFADPESNVGYHVGFFAKTSGNFYLRPELVYTAVSTDYDDNTFNMKKIDAPVLLGLKVLGPVNVFAGPAFHYVLDQKYDEVTLGDAKNDFTVGLNFGVGLNLGKVGLDLRYERDFSENEATFLEDNNIISNGDRIDVSNSQVILSLSLML